MTIEVNSKVPTTAKILVIGGGPAGSYAATLLAREGLDVVLLERDSFPRYHIGESLLPSIPHYLNFIDAKEMMNRIGFNIKLGAAVKFNQYSQEGYTDFTKNPDPTWNVIRSEFDDALLKHAAANGVHVFENTRVTSIDFDPSRDLDAPVGASWKNKSGDEGHIEFEWLVDASGREGIMSTKYLKNRSFNKGLKNVACWGYWRGTGKYGVGTDREGAPYFEALTDQSGWCWFIPLHDGTVSVGVVMNEEISQAKKAAMKAESGGTKTLADHYLEQIHLHLPGIKKLLGSATLETGIKQASDYSYSAGRYSGDRFRMAGDAAAFIDPFFSSGVHLAFNSGLSAACSIAAAINKQCSEEEASNFHNAKTGTAYTRFMVVVLGAYQQIRKQDEPILQDIDEGNFDRAFDLIRPVIQGEADMGQALTEGEVQKAMKFCSAVFAPTSPEMHAEVASRIDPKLMDINGPVLLEEDIIRIVGHKDENAIHVLTEINARKPVHAVYNVGHHFVHEEFSGLVPVISRGKLGLRSTKQQ